VQRLESEQNDQSVLEQVVVESTEKLGQEKRAETPCLKEFELAAHADLPAKGRGRNFMGGILCDIRRLK
jgi:hypothetical protein